MKKAISCLMTTLVLLLTVGSAYFLVSIYVNKDPIPSVFGYCPMIVVSGSMEPELKVNQLVIIKKTSPEECSIGDIIVYRRTKDLIIHRVEHKYGNMLVTKGDANSDIDPPFCEDKIVGKFVTKISALGGLIAFLKTETGTKYLFFTQGLLTCALLRSFIKRGKKKHEKNIYGGREKLHI